MTIDEAIAYEREVAAIQSNNDKLNKTLGVISPYYKTDYVKSAEEHEQLAEWLEELKKRRSEDYGYMADIHQSIGYRQAIDDFVKALRIEYSPVSDEMQNEYDNVCLRFEKIAEQLKAGD